MVLAGLSREPVTTFAALDDPWVLDGRLGAERDEHLGVLAGAPPDQRSSLHLARVTAEHAGRAVQAASADLERAEAHLARFGPLAALRRTVRMERDDAEQAVARAQQRLEAARAERRRSEGRVAELEAAEAERIRFVADTAWRLERVRAINNQLDRHWSAAVLAAVRQDDPLAFGVGRLRAARAVAASDLASYHASLPPDRRAAVTQAERELADARHRRRLAHRALDECRRRLEVASERHWGRRDKEAMARAERALASAEHAVSDAARAEHDARGRLDAEGSKLRRRTKALAATEERRVELTGALAELDAALDDTRAKRVEALAAEPIVPPHLVDVVGEAPSDPHARQAWWGLAWRIEAYRDRHPDALGHEADGGVIAAIGPSPAARWMPDAEWDDLAGQVRHGRSLVALAAEASNADVDGAWGDATAWAEVVEEAGALLNSQRATVDRGVGRETGRSIGW